MERVEINGNHSNKKSSTSTINRTMSVRKTTGLSSTVIHVENGQENPSQNVEERLDIIGIPLHSFSKTQQFFVCCGGVLTFYLIYGYVQEGIFRIEGFKPYGWYLTLVQFGMYFIFGLLQTVTFKDKTRKIPLKTYAGLAFLTVSTMGLSNSSLGYLNYPTQVIFKSCKLIPVMFGGIIIQGKKYKLVDFMACFCMSIGLILFTLADSRLQPNYSYTGVVLISLALCADAIIGNVQEKAIKSYKSTSTEVVLYSYGIGFVYILFGLIAAGQLWDSIVFSSQKPFQIYGLAFLFSVSGYLGILFVLMLVRIFGALTAVTITTFRKAVTIIISFLFITKPFTIQYIWSGLIVGLGIFLNVYSKNQPYINTLAINNVKYLKSRLFNLKSRNKIFHMENV